MNKAGLSIAEGAEMIRSGGVVAYPTEAVYGLGCDPSNDVSVARIHALKNRPLNKPFLLIAADLAQVKVWIDPDYPEELARAKTSWPGPTSWLFSAHPKIPGHLLGEDHTIVLRMTAHQSSRDLCLASGTALVSTSANFSGEPTIKARDQLEASFLDDIDGIVSGPLGKLSSATPIRDARTGVYIRN